METRALSVSQLNKYISGLMEFDEVLSNVVVIGEISNFKRHSSGHFYFSVKDEGSKISCVMFRSNAIKLSFDPIDGMNVIIRGRVSVYEKNGNYQIYVNTMREEGVGTLYEQYNRLLDLLREKGYFDPSHKKKIPFLPNRVALVTSPTGAAVRDMISVMKRRYRGIDILVCPVLVQGETASLDIAFMIDLINRHQLADVIITGRGGGSIEELWAFNERIVAESIYNSEIPVISAVGHETDFTIADFVADLRAATPSAAAELAVPDEQDIIFALKKYQAILQESIIQKISHLKMNVNSVKNISLFSRPFDQIHNAMLQLDFYSEQLKDRMLNRMTAIRSNLDSRSELLNSLSYESILKRGFFIIKKDDQYVTSSEIIERDRIEIISDADVITAEVEQVRKREENDEEN